MISLKIKNAANSIELPRDPGRKFLPAKHKRIGIYFQAKSRSGNRFEFLTPAVTTKKKIQTDVITMPASQRSQTGCEQVGCVFDRLRCKVRAALGMGKPSQGLYVDDMASIWHFFLTSEQLRLGQQGEA
jgi:hypothetical protein